MKTIYIAIELFQSKHLYLTITWTKHGTIEYCKSFKASHAPLTPLNSRYYYFYILLDFLLYCDFILFLSQFFEFVHYEGIEHQKLWDLSVSRGHIR